VDNNHFNLADWTWNANREKMAAGLAGSSRACPQMPYRQRAAPVEWKLSGFIEMAKANMMEAKGVERVQNQQDYVIETTKMTIDTTT
jgi:hypothetical protein